MCNLILQTLKNRTHRVPTLTSEQLLKDEEGIRGIKVIATEYNQGPTTTPWEPEVPGGPCAGESA
jgi:hypothetical protein